MPDSRLGQGGVPIERMLDAVEWSPLPDPETRSDTVPHATHEGVLEIGEFRLRCYQLSDGSRVFDADDVERLFDA